MASVTEALKVLDRGVHALAGLSAVQDNSEGLHLPATFWRAMSLTGAMNRPHFRRYLEGLLVAGSGPSKRSPLVDVTRRNHHSQLLPRR